jgi:hypothetical protein
MAKNQIPLNRKKIIYLLNKLNEKMEQKDIIGEIMIVGGSAIALNHNESRVTQDIDALFEPYKEIIKLVEEIAIEEGLGNDWLNDMVRNVFRQNTLNNEQPKTLVRLNNLTISTGSPKFLLAMKLGVSRLRPHDISDIADLMEQLNIKSKEQLKKVVENVYGERIFTHDGGLLWSTNFNKNINTIILRHLTGKKIPPKPIKQKDFTPSIWQKIKNQLRQDK